MIDVAKEKGVESVYGIIMADNLKMIHLCERLGFTIRKEHENAVAELTLK